MHGTLLRERVPLFATAQELHILPLSDGASRNNTHYKVIADNTAYFLRVGAQTGHFLGIRREEEQSALRAAENIGLAPPILYADATGLMVLPFLSHAWHWTSEEAVRPENIVRLAQTLRKLHAVSEVTASCTVYERIERMMASVERLKLEPPAEIDRLFAWLYALQQERANDTRFPLGLCHGDFWLHNFLDDDKQLWLIDWEFAGVGDGMIDLAKISIGGSCYTPQDQQDLLHAYGYTEPSDIAILDQMKNVLRFFEAAWSLVQHGIHTSQKGIHTSQKGIHGSDNFDYLDHSQKTFALLLSSFGVNKYRR
jgi:thiamine kinase-like enzyme